MTVGASAFWHDYGTHQTVTRTPTPLGLLIRGRTALLSGLVADLSSI